MTDSDQSKRATRLKTTQDPSSEDHERLTKMTNGNSSSTLNQSTVLTDISLHWKQCCHCMAKIIKEATEEEWQWDVMRMTGFGFGGLFVWRREEVCKRHCRSFSFCPPFWCCFSNSQASVDRHICNIHTQTYTPIHTHRNSIEISVPHCTDCIIYLIKFCESRFIFHEDGDWGGELIRPSIRRALRHIYNGAIAGFIESSLHYFSI